MPELVMFMNVMRLDIRFFFQILSLRVYDAPVSYAPKTKKKKE